MINAVILIFEAVVLLGMCFLGYQLLNDAQTGVYLTALGILLSLTEYLRRLIGKREPKETKNMNTGEMVRHAQELRETFENEIMKCRAKKLRKDAVIRHVSRKDQYPNIEEKSKGISPWFKVGLEETYHSGINVGLRIESLKVCPDGYRLTKYKENEEAEIKVMLMGSIPFDVIETVNIDGDEYYSFPHIFCHFPFKSQPYERLFYCEVVMQDHGHPWYKEVADYESVKLNSELTEF